MPTVETATDFAADLWAIFRRHNDGYETDPPADRVAARDAAIRSAELARVVKRLREKAEELRVAAEEMRLAQNLGFTDGFRAANEFNNAADLLEREGAGT